MNVIKGRSARIINLNTILNANNASAPSGAPTSNGERKRSLTVSGGIKHLWLKSYNDHIIRNDDDFNRHIEYLHLNPIKHGLVKEGEEYPLSLYK